MHRDPRPITRSTLRKLRQLTVILGTLLCAHAPLAAVDYLNVSVKVILDANGQRPPGTYGTDPGISGVFASCNAKLNSLEAPFRLYLDEILEVEGLESFASMPVSQLSLLEATASNSTDLGWREDSINIYVTQLTNAGGWCSTPHLGNIIVINSASILNTSFGWLHEIGHYLSLVHTFEACHLPQPTNPAVCTGAGALHTGFCSDIVTCADICDDQFNIMSYHPLPGATATLTPCQIAHMNIEINAPVGIRGVVKFEDDALEENDTCIEATPIVAGVYPELDCVSDDEDWYRLFIPGGETLDLDLAFPQWLGNLDVELYSGCGGVVVASATSGNANEALSYTNPGLTDEFFVRVWVAVANIERYSMTVALSGAIEDCNGNGLPDDFELHTAQAEDCDGDGMLDECDPTFAETPFIRGDANSSGSVEVGDAIAILNYLFANGAAPCLDALDVDDTGIVQINDPINILNYLFDGGTAPSLPGLACGIDPTGDAHECCVYPGCAP